MSELEDVKMAALSRIEALTAERNAARADADRLYAALTSIVHAMVLHESEVAKR